MFLSRLLCHFVLLLLCLYISIYHKNQNVYIEKEIVALATKAGVTSGAILDIHQSLIDDGLIDKEKIGGQNYFWSFPTKKDYKAQLDHTNIVKKTTELKAKIQDATTKLDNAKRGREEDEQGGRAKKLQRLSELATLKSAMLAELDTLKENDPAALANLEKEYKLVRQAAHRWTDNLFECKSYLVKKRGMDKKEASRILGISANFDCKFYLLIYIYIYCIVLYLYTQ